MSHSGSTSPCCCSNKEQAFKVQETKVETPIVKIKKTSRSLPSILMSILIAFFPKCPMCWAVYMSMFGSLGLARLPYMPWLLPVLLVFFAVHLFLLFRKAPQKGYWPFFVSLAGAVIILVGRGFFAGEKWMLITGMCCIISGSLLNSFSSNIRLSNNRFKISF